MTGNAYLACDDVPGLEAAMYAVREFIGAERVTLTGAALIAEQALRAATLPLLAAMFADVSDAAAEEGLQEIALYLDTMSFRIRERTAAT